ncbi:hypothetical protein [Peribacillus frigoritolerans]|uniref:Replicative DNA helicase n=1 Tax=Peribacillus castrilensis TaxID=2897690 RepID=A0AAW9NCL3_9BACI|nr:hypothetical protein [Peribacillus castrilensis]
MNENALQLTFEDIGKRIISLIPAWTIGSGADFGRTQPYSRGICLSLLVYVFYQELTDDPNRTKDDLIQSILKITKQLNLPFTCTYDESVKILESMMWSNSKKFTFAFQDLYFDEKKNNWETYHFHFFELDRDISDLENGHQVYKLSTESQELVLKSHEIIEKMDTTFQQLVAELYIRNANFKSALRVLDALDFQVKNLIQSEKEHKEQIIRNPKKALYILKSKWGDQLEKVKVQFKDETNRYNHMMKTLRSLEILEEHRVQYERLIKRLANTSLLHDQLAGFVIENIRLEIQVKNTQFNLFWKASGSSFRETFWESTINKYGFEHPDDMLSIVESVLSPKKPTILPLEWGIEEHIHSGTDTTFDGTEKKRITKTLEPISVDWEVVLSLWEPAFAHLLSNGEISNTWLSELDELTLVRWLDNRDAYDFWLDFAVMEKHFIISSDTLKDTSNLKAVLIKKLIENNAKFKDLYGMKIVSRSIYKDVLNHEKRVSVSKYHFTLEECEEYE